MIPAQLTAAIFDLQARVAALERLVREFGIDVRKPADQVNRPPRISASVSAYTGLGTYTGEKP